MTESLKSRNAFGKPLNLTKGRVDLAHGSGGRAMAQLVEELFLDAFDNEYLNQGNDQAAFDIPAALKDGGRLAMSTDGYVISPIFFPGGDIGSLAVHGTVNDVAMSGGRPLYLSAGFIIEEGFPLADLKRVVDSMAAASRKAQVPVVTGDTKVVERGKGDGIFITTAGVGVIPPGIDLGGSKLTPGDKIIASGTLGDHGVAVMSKREGLEFETEILSDSQALHFLIADMVAASPAGLKCLRDPTRGGLAATLNELARQSGVGMLVQEADIPLRADVKGACELLGLDPLYVANEGKLLAFVAPDAADTVLAAMQANEAGVDAAIIGEVTEDEHFFVQMETAFGGRRIVDWIAGEQLPRIC
ncbi:MAG: hydrogenase expression/formation protein HypE [Magnetovibrionaceae bacterium]